MTFDDILSNPPYGTIGVKIAKNIIGMGNDIVYIGTLAMAMTDSMACEYCYPTATLHDWVRQVIVMAWGKGRYKTERKWLGSPYRYRILDDGKVQNEVAKPYELRIAFSYQYGVADIGSYDLVTTRSRRSSVMFTFGSEEERYRAYCHITDCIKNYVVGDGYLRAILSIKEEV